MGEPAPRNPVGDQSNAMLSEEVPIKTTRKIHNQKFQELTANDIFKGDTHPGSAEKSLSSAKLRKMSGSNIFWCTIFTITNEDTATGHLLHFISGTGFPRS